jgi:RNA polymerase sigma factor (sigma-70 family)
MEDVLRLEGIAADLVAWGMSRERAVSEPEPAASLEELVAGLSRQRPEDERQRAWRGLVAHIGAHFLPRLIARARRSARDLDPVAVLNEVYLGLLETPPSDPAKLRLEFRVLDAARRIRRAESSSPAGRVSLEAVQEVLPGRDEKLLPETVALEQDAARTLDSLVEALPEGRIRDVARLRYQEGLPLEQIAQRLDVAVGTIKSDLSREVRPRLVRAEKEQRWHATLRREAR